MYKLLTYQNLDAFPRVKWFEGKSHYWRTDGTTDARLFIPALFRWELSVSRFRPSQIEFSRTSFLLKERFQMARNEGKNGSPVVNPFKGFINISIQDVDKPGVESAWSKAKYAEIIGELVDIGKVSVSFNPKNQTYNAAIVFYSGDCANWCVSSFAPNALMALYLTWFKCHNYPELIVPDAVDVNKPVYG